MQLVVETVEWPHAQLHVSWSCLQQGFETGGCARGDLAGSEPD